MFNTQFPGLDIAGNYIREHAEEGDRMLHSSGQSFGVLWHADIPGYKPVGSVEDFQRAEEENGVSWVLSYQWGFQHYCFFTAQCSEIDQQRGQYLRENYRLVQFGFMQAGQQAQPLFMLFRKGGTFNETQLNSMLQNNPVRETTYYYTSGPYKVLSIDTE